MNNSSIFNLNLNEIQVFKIMLSLNHAQEIESSQEKKDFMNSIAKKSLIECRKGNSFSHHELVVIYQSILYMLNMKRSELDNNDLKIFDDLGSIFVDAIEVMRMREIEEEY